MKHPCHMLCYRSEWYTHTSCEGTTPALHRGHSGFSRHQAAMQSQQYKCPQGVQVTLLRGDRHSGHCLPLLYGSSVGPSSATTTAACPGLQLLLGGAAATTSGSTAACCSVGCCPARGPTCLTSGATCSTPHTPSCASSSHPSTYTTAAAHRTHQGISYHGWTSARIAQQHTSHGSTTCTGCARSCPPPVRQAAMAAGSCSPPQATVRGPCCQCNPLPDTTPLPPPQQPLLPAVATALLPRRPASPRSSSTCMATLPTHSQHLSS
jgi:hypothetical protein